MLSFSCRLASRLSELPTRYWLGLNKELRLVGSRADSQSCRHGASISQPVRSNNVGSRADSQSCRHIMLAPILMSDARRLASRLSELPTRFQYRPLPTPSSGRLASRLSELPTPFSCACSAACGESAREPTLRAADTDVRPCSLGLKRVGSRADSQSCRHNSSNNKRSLEYCRLASRLSELPTPRRCDSR